MSSSLGGMGSAGGENLTLKAMMEVQQENTIELGAEKRTAKEAFKTSLQEMVNPFAAKIRKNGKSLKANTSRISKLLQKGEKADRLEAFKFMKQKGDEFERRNPELKSKSLVALRERIKPDDTAEEILQKVKESYPDVTLADEALEFLLETTEGDLFIHVKDAKNKLHETSEREIIAGKNISELARETEGLGTPTTLRDLYRNITISQKEAPSLFEELSRLYPFNQLKKVFKFLFHSLGSDMKSKGPSIPKGQLFVLMKQTRTLQAILGVYRFFAGRMKLVQKMFAKEGEKVPPRINFETMAKQFMQICADRYPSSTKLLEISKDLGVSNSVIGKIIVLTQFRDALDQVSREQIFRSSDHKDELSQTVIATLEELEYEWEEIQSKVEEPEENHEI